MTYKHLETNPTTENILLSYGNDPKYDYLHQTKEPSTTDSETLSAPAYASTPSEQPSPFTPPKKEEGNSPDSIQDPLSSKSKKARPSFNSPAHPDYELVPDPNTPINSIPTYHIDKNNSYQKQYFWLKRALLNYEEFQYLNDIDDSLKTVSKAHYPEMEYFMRLQILVNRINSINARNSRRDYEVQDKKQTSDFLTNFLDTFNNNTDVDDKYQYSPEYALSLNSGVSSTPFSPKATGLFYNCSKDISNEQGVPVEDIWEMTKTNINLLSSDSSTKSLNKIFDKYPEVFNEILNQDDSPHSSTVYAAAALLMTRETLNAPLPQARPNYSEVLPEIRESTKTKSKKNLDYDMSIKSAGFFLHDTSDKIYRLTGNKITSDEFAIIRDKVKGYIADLFEQNDSLISEELVKNIVFHEFTLLIKEKTISRAERDLLVYHHENLQIFNATKSTSDTETKTTLDPEGLILNDTEPQKVISNLFEQDWPDFKSPDGVVGKNPNALPTADFTDNAVKALAFNFNLSEKDVKKIMSIQKGEFYNTNELEILNTRYRRKYPDFYKNVPVNSNLDFKTTEMLRAMEGCSEQHSLDTKVKTDFNVYFDKVNDNLHLYSRVKGMTEKTRETEFAKEFKYLYSEGYSREEAHQALIDFSDTILPHLKHQYKVSQEFYEIMTERYPLHNVHIGLLNIYYNIANGSGEDLVEAQRILNEAAKQANANGASSLGEWGGNFIRDNLFEIGLLVASFIAPGIAIPKTIERLYGGAKMISTLRSKYNLMKHQNKSDREIAIALTLKYGFAKINGFAKNKTTDFIRAPFKSSDDLVNITAKGGAMATNHVMIHDIKSNIKNKKNNN